MKLTIGQKIFLGWGVAVLCLALAGFAAYRSMGQLREANNGVRQTSLLIAELGALRADLVEIESAGRGYVLNGDERFLESIEGSRTQLAGRRKLVRTLAAGNPAQQRRLDAVDPLLDRGLADWTRIASARREKGFAAALAAILEAKSRERMAEIGALLAALENEERTLLSARETIVQVSAQSANGIILYGGLLALALSAGIAIVARSSLAGRLSELQHFAASVAAGDLTQKPAREGSDELGRLACGLNQMVTRIRSTTTRTRAVTESLSSATMEILATAKEQSALTGEQVAAYQETNATMQQVSQSCLQISEKAKQVTISAAAVSLANTTGLDAVQKANQSVEAIHEQAEAVARNIVSLSEKTQAVGDILATVNDIAEQSHLLALNAAIEAAAAGEHGRSFAVVAGEIKNLADQSKSATVQVKTILGDIQKEINTSVMLTEEAVKRVDVGKIQADAAASAIRNMAANIDQSVQAFQQIVAGTNQQQIGFDNVMQALKDLSRAAEQAASSTRQTEQAAADLTDLSTQLSAATEGYRL